jgi:hypothetical protein
MMFTAAFAPPASNDAARVEVAAARTLMSDFATSRDSSKATFADDWMLLEPRYEALAARSSVAGDLLSSSGLSAAEIDAIGEAWLAALGSTDRNAPVEGFGQGATWSPTLDSVAALFIQSVGPLTSDETLVGAPPPTPALDAHLVEACPDVALGGGEGAG